MSAIVKDLSAVSHCKDCELNKLNWGRCYQFLRGCPIVGELPDKHGALVDIAEVKEKLLKYGFSAPDLWSCRVRLEIRFIFRAKKYSVMKLTK